MSTRTAFVFSREYPPVTIGGTSTVTRNLAVGLVGHGWRVVVVSANPHGGDECAEIDGVIVHRTGMGSVYHPESGLADATLTGHRRLHRAAEDLAARYGPVDVVALPDLFCFPEAALFARGHGRPLVNILLQDFRTLTRQDRDRHHVTTGVSAEQEHLFALEERALRGSDHVAFISRALSDAILGYYPDLTTPSSVEYLGVDAAEIASVAADAQARAKLRAGLPGDGPVVVACGRLVPVKGFTPLLEALALLGSGGLRPRLALVGVGPEEAGLRPLAAERGIADRVTFLGDIPRRTALTWMSLATVAVVPSLWESFCYVCAEMMAFGRPVVATAVDSLNELMPTQEYGYRVPVTVAGGARVLDPRRLAEALAAALADPDAAARRGTAARERILGEFTNARFAQRMDGLCDRLASGYARA